MSYKVANEKVGRFSQSTKPRPQKLANFIDHLTPALAIQYCLLCETGRHCVFSQFSANHSQLLLAAYSQPAKVDHSHHHVPSADISV